MNDGEIYSCPLCQTNWMVPIDANKVWIRSLNVHFRVTHGMDFQIQSLADPERFAQFVIKKEMDKAFVEPKGPRARPSRRGRRGKVF